MSEQATTSWRVIQGAARGDRELRESFAQRYAPIMQAYFGARWRSTAIREDVGDAVQEAFLECFRPDGVLQTADPQRPGGFRAYLFGLLRNVALRVEQRRVRDGRLTPQQAETLDVLVDGGDSATAVFDREWARALMREAASRQAAHAGAKDAAAKRRVELLRLRFQDRLPIRDIAKQWGVEADVLHREYAKARREFEAALRAVVVEHHPGDEGEVERTLREIVRALGR